MSVSKHYTSLLSPHPTSKSPDPSAASPSSPDSASTTNGTVVDGNNPEKALKERSKLTPKEITKIIRGGYDTLNLPSLTESQKTWTPYREGGVSETKVFLKRLAGGVVVGHDIRQLLESKVHGSGKGVGDGSS